MDVSSTITPVVVFFLFFITTPSVTFLVFVTFVTTFIFSPSSSDLGFFFFFFLTTTVLATPLSLFLDSCFFDFVCDLPSPSFFIVLIKFFAPGGRPIFFFGILSSDLALPPFLFFAPGGRPAPPFFFILTVDDDVDGI